MRKMERAFDVRENRKNITYCIVFNGVLSESDTVL